MRRTQQSLLALFSAILLSGLLVVCQSNPARADVANTPSLTISQLKITSSNGQFVTLYNATNTALDMSKYQLEYFNSYDLSKATSSKLIALSGIVPPHGYFMVNDSSLLLCYQLRIDSVSLGLSSTAGLIEVLAFNQSNPGSSVTPVLQDYVAWSKTAASGAQTLPTNTSAFLQRLPVDAKSNPSISTPGAGSWQGAQPDGNNPCSLIGSGSGSNIQTGLSQLLPSTEPPAIILDSSGDVVTTSSPWSLPAADIGLMAPTITEILPNPSGTGNDSTDEFIELYNANSTVFDLSGFSLQVGTSSFHTYTFPAGTSLAPQSFTAFYPTTTILSLSNTGGQVKLLDPAGNSIAASEVYATANDGQSWALANGKWYWTTTTTPNGANIINQPPAKKKAVAKTTSAKTKATKAITAKVKGAKTIKTTAATSANEEPTTSPIHLWILALVAGLALLYGAYEYRADIANRIYRLRQHFGDRHADR